MRGGKGQSKSLEELRRRFRVTKRAIKVGERTVLENCLDEPDLATLEKIMSERTGYTFERLANEVDFRTSGIIVKASPPNMDNATLTTASSGSRRSYVFPGGKVDPRRIPFSAFLFAEFWQQNESVYMAEVFTGKDKYNAALVRVLDRGDSGSSGFIEPLEELGRRIDHVFDDGLTEVRTELYREMEEELGMRKVSRRTERRLAEISKKLKGKVKLNSDEERFLIGKEIFLSGDGETSIAYVRGAEPVGVYLDLYRVPIQGSDEVAKKLFVSLNYLLDVDGSWEDVDKTVKDGYRRKGQAEVTGVRWVSLVEVAAPGYDNLYLDSVHYMARRLSAQGKVRVEAREGYVGGGKSPTERAEVVLPDTFGNGIGVKMVASYSGK